MAAAAAAANLVLIQQLQATVQQLQQQVAANPNAPGGAAPPAAAAPVQQIADPALLSLMRLQSAAAVTPITFRGESTGLEARRWLNSTVLYLESAQIVADADRLMAIGRLFVGGAANWWQKERDRPANDPLKITTWAQFEAALKKRYEPVDAGTWARTQLNALVEKGFNSVLAYTDRFNEINAAITDMAEPDRIFYYRKGLPTAVQNALATKKVDKLDELSEHALRWEAVRVAVNPSGSSGGSSGQGSSGNRYKGNNNSSLHQMEDGELEENGSPPTDRTSALEAQLNRLEAQLKSFGSDNKKKPFKKPAGSRGRSEGVSNELARARIAARLCIHCGASDHIKRDCTNDVSTKPVPAGSSN